MAITAQDHQELIEYIEGRMCKEYRVGDPCCDGPAGARVRRAAPHGGCINADRILAIARRI